MIKIGLYNTKAAIFERHDLEYLNVIEDAKQPTITDQDVLIKVKAAEVNLIDYFTVACNRN